MRFDRTLTIAGALLLIGWLGFFAIKFTQHRNRMRVIASELSMQNRKFYLAGAPLEPHTAIEGEERLLVVGESNDDYLLCSIVRNTTYNDWRGQWKVDVCFRPDRQPDHPRLAIWETMDHFPTQTDIVRFKTLALQQPWVTWDKPEGSNPITSSKQ
ncbi:hypothetical protein [Rhodopirellula sp. MGV]|uniref:hypothetical protein n=1 Tax=Rhodopirellula sp. MGV TaxID=2023130 RepID=UPI000B97C070|nr:hypothetical protein [Rhodopirellula sp. MGV]OYP30410.1 hypothetical protein CGZ80_22410 [Rhodopirellula sp. MGV]PNY35054.1 hypothetical protein C2E31_20310 [Rhodopirellula baltica]PNY36795.1 hypothetical protein C2E31_11120 [Rhodopirellula baltica]